MTTLVLLENINVDTVGEGFYVDGGTYNLCVYADDFGGGTVILETSPNGGIIWIPLGDWSTPTVPFTFNRSVGMDYVGGGLKLRANFSGSSGASNLNVKLFS